MTDQSKQFPTQDCQQTWKQKYLKLQNELLEARIEQINLKRINKGLEETLKLAMNEDSIPETSRTSTQRMNLTWKQKYQSEVEKNFQHQRYIKVLEVKRNTLSGNKSARKRQSSTNSNTNFKTTSQPRHTYTSLNCLQQNDTIQSKTLDRNSSVKKMEGFMERLMKQKYVISDFGVDNYVKNYPSGMPTKMKLFYARDDPIEKLFGSVKGVAKENRFYLTEEEDKPLKVRHSIINNSIPNRNLNIKTVQSSISRKLTLTSHLR